MKTLHHVEDTTVGSRLPPRAGIPRPLVVCQVAPGCRESAQLALTVSKLARDYEGQLDFISVNPLSEASSAGGQPAPSSPGLLVLWNGAVLYQVIGTLPERELHAIFESARRRGVYSTATGT